jgi:multiple antibiotic resistance protein
VLWAFFLAGKFILSFFGISLGVLQIAGGLVVSHTAWEMVSARPRLTEHENREAVDMEDISFTPMAVPIVSGPGAIGVTIGMSEQTTQWTGIVGCLLGITLLGIILYLLLALGEPLVKILGKNGLGMMNRILGFFVLAIAVQLIVNGALALLKESIPSLLRS